jgi:hypothetical protein
VQIYYRAGNLSDAEIAKMQAFAPGPPGLQMIVDNVPDSNVNWECAEAGDANNPQYNYPQNCADGYTNTLHIFFPQKDRAQGCRLRPLEHCENIGALAESGQSREEIAMRKIGLRDLLLKRRDA